MKDKVLRHVFFEFIKLMVRRRHLTNPEAQGLLNLINNEEEQRSLEDQINEDEAKNA